MIKYNIILSLSDSEKIRCIKEIFKKVSMESFFEIHKIGKFHFENKIKKNNYGIFYFIKFFIDLDNLKKFLRIIRYEEYIIKYILIKGNNDFYMKIKNLINMVNKILNNNKIIKFKNLNLPIKYYKFLVKQVKILRILSLISS